LCPARLLNFNILNVTEWIQVVIGRLVGVSLCSSMVLLSIH
jgi:hypothetical protein